jgi:hypothetical protein
MTWITLFALYLGACAGWGANEGWRGRDGEAGFGNAVGLALLYGTTAWLTIPFYLAWELVSHLWRSWRDPDTIETLRRMYESEHESDDA